MRIFCFLALILSLYTCRKLKMANNPAANPQDLSILELKKLYTKGSSSLQITENLRITGTIIANDKSGNFYKKIILQDSSSGIAINLDGYNLYTEYPIGQKITVLCQGLSLADYANNISLGLAEPQATSNLSGIPMALASKYLSKEAGGKPIIPKVVDIGKLSTRLYDPYQNTLISLVNVEADSASIDKTLGDAQKLKPNKSLILRDCRHQQIELRTSSYASFASQHLPLAKGKVTGIFSPYVNANSNAKVLSLRDFSELDFSEPRCVFRPQLKRISELRAYMLGEVFPADWYIEAWVISNSKNEPQLNYVLQDASGGILIRFDKISYAPKLKLGDRVRLSLELLRLTNYRGNLQLANIPASNLHSLSDSKPAPAPKGKTIQNLHAELPSDQSLPHTLVALTEVQVGSAPRVFSYGDGNSARGENHITCYAIYPANQGNSVASWRDTIYTCVRSKAEIHLGNFVGKKLDSLKGYVANYNGRAQLYLRTDADIVCKEGNSECKKKALPARQNAQKPPKAKGKKSPKVPKKSKKSLKR